jgi:N-acetylmuramoyl-L-alanine amidase
VTYPAAFAAMEKTYNLRIAQLVRDRLLACGLQVTMTREGDDSVSSQTRVGIMNSLTPQASATLAFNVTNSFMGSSGQTGSGPEAWVNPVKPGDGAFGAQIVSQVSTSTGLPARGPAVKDANRNPGGPIYVALHAAPLFAHAELAFLDNYYDRALIDDPLGKGMPAIADGVFMAFLDKLGGPSICLPCLHLPEPLSAADRARLRNLG